MKDNNHFNFLKENLVCANCRIYLRKFRNYYLCPKCKQRYLFNNLFIDMNPLDIGRNNWIRDEYEYWQKEYENHKRIGKNNPKTGNRLAVRSEMIQILLKNIKITPQTSILDVGSGDGYTSYYLLNPDKKPHRYVALDVSEKGLLLLKSRIKSAIAVRALIEKIPFRNKSFDVIFCWGVLHHTKAKEKLILKLKNLLKKDGMLLLFEGIETQTALLRLTRKLAQTIISESEHEERINEYKLKKVLQANFRTVWYKKEYTPVRTLMIFLTDLLGITDKYDLVNTVVRKLDTYLIKYFGRYFKSLSGGAVTFVGIKK